MKQSTTTKAQQDELIFRQHLKEVWKFAQKGTKSIDATDPPMLSTRSQFNDPRHTTDIWRSYLVMVIEELECALGCNGFEVIDFVQNLCLKQLDYFFDNKRYPELDTNYELVFRWNKDPDGKNRVYTHYSITTNAGRSSCQEQQFTL